MALRSIPTPTYENTHMAKSNIFHCTSERISTTIDKWQKQEYSRDWAECCGRSQDIEKWRVSTRWMSRRSRRRAAAMQREWVRVMLGRMVARFSYAYEGTPHILKLILKPTFHYKCPPYIPTSQIIMQLSIILLLLLCLQSTLSAYCHGKPKDYYTNDLPIWNKPSTLLRKHQHGELHQIGQGRNLMKLLHVYGNMYQMGYAHGALLRDELHGMIGELWGYIEGQVQDAIGKKLPRFMRKGAANFALGTVLDLNYQITLPFTNSKYYDQMRGIADASGVDFKYFRRIHMIGQLTKGACSMFGAWGNATSEGQTVQMRALDWDLEGPFRNYPLAIVYHPSSPKYGYTWLNIGFVGWVGVLSGVNEHQLAVSEIGVTYPDSTFGKESRFGNPFTFVLRDVLQWDKTLTQSIHRMQTTRRTCNLILGVGDGKGQFRSFQYSHSVCNVIGDTNPLPKADWHPALQNVVYYGMDWLCPPYHERIHELLDKYHGNITAELAVRTIIPGTNTGNLQIAVYDLTHKKVYFSYGNKQNGHTVDAYHRPYIMLDLQPLFAYKMQQ